MFGIIVGTLCFLALIGVLAHGRRRRWAGRGCGHGGYGMSGPRWWLRGVFERLGTSPSQEKVIVEVANEVREEGRKLWGEWEKSKADLAEALRAEPLDEAKVAQAFERHDGLFAQLRKSALAALGKVHGVLDPDQRRALAQMIEHPYRCHDSCGC